MKKKHLITLGALIGGGLLTYKLLKRKKKTEANLPASGGNSNSTKASPALPTPKLQPIQPVVTTPELPALPALPELPTMQPMSPAKVPNFGKGLPELPKLPIIPYRPPRITAELEDDAEERRGLQAGLGRIEKGRKKKAKKSKAKSKSKSKTAKHKLSGVIDDLGKKYAIDGTDLARIKKQLKAPSAKQIAKKSASNSEKIRELSKELNKLKRKTKAKAKPKPKPKAAPKTKAKTKAKAKPKAKTKAIAKTPSSSSTPLLAQIQQAGLKKKVAKPSIVELIPTAKILPPYIREIHDRIYRPSAVIRAWQSLYVQKVPEKTKGFDFNKALWQHLTSYQQISIIWNLSIQFLQEELDKVNKRKAILYRVTDERFFQAIDTLVKQRQELDSLGTRIYEDKSGISHFMVPDFTALQMKYWANVRSYIEKFLGGIRDENRLKEYCYKIYDNLLEGRLAEFSKVFKETSKLTDLSKCKVPPLKIPSYWDLEKKYKTN